MEKLIAVNEKAAIFAHVDSCLEKTLDPHKFLRDLLAIRSARGLVSFLTKHPLEFVRNDNPGLIDVFIDACEAPTGYLKFSGASMMKAAESCGVSYYDEIVRLDIENADGIKNWGFYGVEISPLEHIAKRAEKLLNIASLYYDPAPGQWIKKVESKEAEGANLIVHPVYVGGLFPDSEEYLLSVGEILEYGEKLGSTQYLESKDGLLLFNTDSDEKTAIKEAAGILVSAALTALLWSSGKMTHVTCSDESGLQLHRSEDHELVLELSRIVIDRDFSICPQCKRPFIGKSRDAHGSLRKKYCSNSCKVAASKEVV